MNEPSVNVNGKVNNYYIKPISTKLILIVNWTFLRSSSILSTFYKVSSNITRVHKSSVRRPVAASTAFFINQNVVFVCYRRIIGGRYRAAIRIALPPHRLIARCTGLHYLLVRFLSELKTKNRPTSIGAKSTLKWTLLKT